MEFAQIALIALKKIKVFRQPGFQIAQPPLPEHQFKDQPD